MKYIVVIFFLIVSSTCFGQFSETIMTGRPGQSIGAFTVGKNVLQFQQGVEYFSSDGQNSTQKGFLTNNVVRFGILETLEFSALVDYRNDQTRFDTASVTSQGLSNVHIGIRVHINEQNGWIPVTGFQMRLKMPNVSNDFGSNQLATVMIFVANWALPKDISLATNWILDYNGNDAKPTGKYVINLGFPIHKKLSGFLGNYGQVYQSTFQTRFEGGFAFLVNNDFAIDLSSGFGKNQGIMDYFVSAGVSYRILKFKNKTL